MAQAVADRRGERGALADTAELCVKPESEIAHERPAAPLPNGLAFMGWLAADPALDGIERAYAQQDLGGDRRGGVGVDLVKAPAQMGPAEGERDRAVVAPIGERAEAAIAIHLQRAPEACEMPGGPDALAVRGVDIGDRRRPGAAARSVIGGIGPDPPVARPASAGLQGGQRRVVGEHPRMTDHVS